MDPEEIMASARASVLARRFPPRPRFYFGGGKVFQEEVLLGDVLHVEWGGVRIDPVDVPILRGIRDTWSGSVTVKAVDPEFQRRVYEHLIYRAYGGWKLPWRRRILRRLRGWVRW